jgi:hypothetical protein
MKPRIKSTTTKKHTLQTASESALKLSSSAIKAEVSAINTVVAKMFAIGRNIEKEGVALANLGIQLGFHFQTATGRDQLEMFLFERLTGLSSKVTFDLAQRAVSLVNRFGANHRFTTFAEAQPELKNLFPILGIAPKPQRVQLGTPVLMDWGAWIPTHFTSLNKELEQLFAAEPVEVWLPDRCETFLAQTEFIEQKREAVKKKMGI